MNQTDFPRLGERLYEDRLPCGLLVRVVPKPGFAKTYAFLAVDYGSIDTAFTANGVRVDSPRGVAHYLEHKMFDMPDGSAMQQFSKFGGNPNAFTSYDITAYYVECTDHVAENLRTLNASLPAYSRVAAIELRAEEFEKTPKQSIKRYLYE